MASNDINLAGNKLARIIKSALLGATIVTLSGCFGVDSDNDGIESAVSAPDTTTQQPDDSSQPEPEIPDLALADIEVRDRPHIDTSLGYNVIQTDMNTSLRGVSLSLDGGDPYNAEQAKTIPTIEQLESLVHDYGFNTLHVYLEGDAEQNPDAVGVNETLADELVELTRQAKMYLIITIGNNGENGAIHSMEKSLAFWNLYGAKYKDETHVIYEAHNEPVSLINENWTEEDWQRQAQMYEAIRTVAPDTMILLGSFMSFYGGSEAIAGADSLKEQFPDIWDNAAFAFHAYWDLPGVESTIAAFKGSTDYPALVNTEFWPGDTKNGYNEAFESHHIGWMQFEWLGANNLDLGHIKYSLDSFGTVWRPDSGVATWPSAGTPTVPFGEEIGLYNRAGHAFLSVDESGNLMVSDHSFDGEGQDTFVVVDAGDDGHIALKAANGKYLTVADFGTPMTATADEIGSTEKLKWLELPSGDIALRPWAGSGHLVGLISDGDDAHTGYIGSAGDGAMLNGGNTFLVVTEAADAPLPMLDEPSDNPPGPFYGQALPVPTNGAGAHPYNMDAPNGRLWAADYDFGGEGVAYHDSSAVNLGDAYRFEEAVDVEATNEGYTAVGFFEDEEWMEYTIDVAQAGNYIVTLRTASATGGLFNLESNCVDLTGTVATPNTGWWDIWQDIDVEVTLEAGVQKLRVVSGGGFNLMNMDIQVGGEGSTEFGEGCQWAPEEPADVRVEAEEWTSVIELPDGEVVLETTQDVDGNQNVGYIDPGDWMEYSVEIPEAGCYIADYRVATESGSEGFTLSFEGVVKDTVTIPPTGGWQSWITLSNAIELNGGMQTMRFDAIGGAQNVNWFEFNLVDASECEEQGEVVLGDNLLTNGAFDDATGWTVVSQWGEDVDGNGVVTVADGVASFTETVAGPWTKHMGLYTTIELQPGTYQFDMDMSYENINELWGEVYIGSMQPLDHSEYNGDQQVIKAYNSWDCPDVITYTGLATESGCDLNENPGRFEITEAGTYYLLFRSGANTYGTTGVTLDNWTVKQVNPPVTEPPVATNLITNGSFEDDSGWTVVSQWGEDVDGNGVVTIADGVATFGETVAGPWTKHMGMYTVVDLQPGTYQFDMDMSYADINELWGEVYIGTTQPEDHSEYNGDQQVLVAYNSWDCPDAITYTGAATASGCDGSDNPGQFEITEAGTHYLLFRSGANTYGTTGVILDNWSLVAVE
ncbi:carbohydrate-binding protein [Thalassotalea sp. Y01]|uniref:carbohydrate-binding protein n=1 Tax=Thalassotalea sp. Y01 TaxID=2729613 RepID=UPI00145CCCCB|nr:carbohydrate-binding protein [Thalassotalea sp. Y01]NMP16918.1 carbohydrate-binding protein [Thalassotalea sp. Y01]